MHCNHHFTRQLALILAFVLWCGSAGWAQTWWRSLGMGEARGVSVTADGGLLVTGKGDRSQTGGVLARLDASGGVLWLKTYALGERAWLNRAVELPDGRIVAVGARTMPAPGWTCLLFLTLDPNGNVLSSVERSLPGALQYEDAYTLVLDAAGNPVIGYSDGTSGYGIVLTCDALGNPIQATKWQGTGPAISGSYIYQGTSDLVALASGGVMLVGGTNDGLPVVARLDALGNELWHLAGVPGDPNLVAGGFGGIVERNDGTFVLVGSRIDTNTTAARGWILAVSATGNVLWERALPPTSTVHFSFFASIERAPNGAVVVAGIGYSGSYRHLRLFEFDYFGNLTRQGIYEQLKARNVPDLVRTPDGGFVAVGGWAGMHSFGDMVVKVDRNGGGCAALPPDPMFVQPVTTDLSGPFLATPHGVNMVPATVVVSPHTGDSVYCYAEDPGVAPLGGNVGGTLAFQYQMSSCPNLLVVTGLSATGGSQPIGLPGNVTAFLDVDFLTTWFLNLSPASQVVLDATGAGTTAPVPVPNNPALVGLPLWVVGLAYQPGQGIVQTTRTVEFALQ